MHDMHCHLDFIAGADAVAAEALGAGTLLFANTVTPDGYDKAMERFDQFENVRVGFGMHPWWVGEASGPAATDEQTGPTADPRPKSQRAADRERIAETERYRETTAAERAQIDSVVARLNDCQPRLIGEIGLDLGWRHQRTRLAQVRMLEAVALWAARRKGRLLSLHSIRAAKDTLDVLEHSGALDLCDCIFHWFSGPSDQLKRAIDAGCYFSCGLRMLETRKGREYVKAIPTQQLLLETDAPPERGKAYSFANIQRDLQTVAAAIAEIKGESALSTIAETSLRLLCD